MLNINDIASDFSLPRLANGKERLYSDDGRLAFLVFYKFSCPTCGLALPFINRIYEVYRNDVRFFAIAQDGAEKTQQFVTDYRLTLPVLLDESPYPVSRQYQLVSVPTIFLINPDHTIRYSGEGFVKQELLNLADVVAEKSGKPQIELFGSENVPEFKPG
ncbi:TlpA family protein disulfide reductase [bacterium]|nr:TlpA family protein disulfide reductase [bacterium]